MPVKRAGRRRESAAPTAPRPRRHRRTGFAPAWSGKNCTRHACALNWTPSAASSAARTDAERRSAGPRNRLRRPLPGPARRAHARLVARPGRAVLPAAPGGSAPAAGTRPAPRPSDARMRVASATVGSKSSASAASRKLSSRAGIPVRVFAHQQEVAVVRHQHQPVAASSTGSPARYPPSATRRSAAGFTSTTPCSGSWSRLSAAPRAAPASPRTTQSPDARPPGRPVR